MKRREFSREELFALVWERPTSEVAKELGISDVALAKLCRRLQVPKPPRGYWAKIQSGRGPRRPPLGAFREEIDRRRRETARIEAAGTLSSLQQQFYSAAVADLKAQGVDAEVTGNRLVKLDPNLAAQLLLLIQNRAHEWVKQGKIDARWSHSLQGSAASLVGKLLPFAQPQLLMFESEHRNRWSSGNGPAVLVRLTVPLQERIASLVRMVREHQLHYVVMPLTSADHSWSARYIHTPDSRMFLDSTLCISASEIWVQSTRRAWREEEPPECIGTARLALREIMPIDYMPTREVPLPPSITRATVAPYRDRLRALIDAEQVCEMLSGAARAMERNVPNDTLALADRIWFGADRPFRSARDAWSRIEEELEQWETELEVERSAVAKSILGIEIGDIVTGQVQGRSVRISVTSTAVYSSEKGIIFVVDGTRFRKDGTLGRQQDAIRLYFANDV
ncbi:RWP-RK domain-containing protein [Mesorhizobium sp. B283B1A]|uniref:RWP-RK domain-containing protein n=1 Tax=Mesorhizobium TaxID=68287 RepID=UPI001CD0A402|nr:MULTISPECIES: RWP-RK domain-containing protein [Mesorhizobium]MCA0050636.1 RWP-RK domain-containing protein [Mesorhizobium sp. B283B1A]UQS66932.1 RWP-RK domain-containing protein [Mesorhizobium opportunistum]